MPRLHLVVAGAVVALLGFSCVVSEEVPLEGITASDEEFIEKYRDMDLSYYDDVVEIETLAAKGDVFYKKYFKSKKKGKPDPEMWTKALETYDKAVKKATLLIQETGASSLQRIQRSLSTNMQILLREKD